MNDDMFREVHEYVKELKEENMLAEDEFEEEFYDFFSLSSQDRENIKHIASRVKDLWRTYTSLPYYTTHGPDHNNQVISILKQLLTEVDIKSEFDEKERFLLLAGAWLHDIGMLDLKDFSERFNHRIVRETHHERSATWIQANTKDLNLCVSEADVVCHMVKYHRKKVDLNNCPNYLWVGRTRVHCSLLAAFLRLADALHVDETRASDIEYSLYKMTGLPPESKFHWVKARAVQGVWPNPARHTVIVQIGIPEDKSDEDFRPLADFVRQEIEDEIETVRHTMANSGYSMILSVNVQLIRIPGLKLGSNRANEIAQLNSLISIDVSPNARTLTQVILNSLNQIAVLKGKPATSRETIEALEAFKDYAKDLIPKIVPRRCHVAVIKLFLVLIKLLSKKSVGGKDLEGDLVGALDIHFYPSSVIGFLID